MQSGGTGRCYYPRCTDNWGRVWSGWHQGWCWRVASTAQRCILVNNAIIAAPLTTMMASTTTLLLSDATIMMKLPTFRLLQCTSTLDINDIALMALILIMIPTHSFSLRTTNSCTSNIMLLMASSIDTSTSDAIICASNNASSYGSLPFMVVVTDAGTCGSNTNGFRTCASNNSCCCGSLPFMVVLTDAGTCWSSIWWLWDR